MQLVYPQWSAGTVRSFQSGVTDKYGKFVTPYSQIPTASPLIRLRVGDLFASNHTNMAIARMMGMGTDNFNLGMDNPPLMTEPDFGDGSSSKTKEEQALIDLLAQERDAATDASWDAIKADPTSQYSLIAKQPAYMIGNSIKPNVLSTPSAVGTGPNIETSEFVYGDTRAVLPPPGSVCNFYFYPEKLRSIQYKYPFVWAFFV